MIVFGLVVSFPKQNNAKAYDGMLEDSTPELCTLVGVLRTIQEEVKDVFNGTAPAEWRGLMHFRNKWLFEPLQFVRNDMETPISSVETFWHNNRAFIHGAFK